MPENTDMLSSVISKCKAEYPDIIICAIVGMAENRVIGDGNTLIWHLPGDLKRLKKITMGKPLVMGRKTYESIGRPLPGRRNIVLSRSMRDPVNNDGPFFTGSLDSAFEDAFSDAYNSQQNEIFIFGGSAIYEQTLPFVERLYLTVVHQDFEGDSYFPEIDKNKWKTRTEEYHDGDLPFSTYVLERKI